MEAMMTTAGGTGIRFWESALREQAESGLTVGEYCQLIEKSTYQFYYWKRRVAGDKPTSTVLRESNEQRFIEVRPTNLETRASRDYADQVDIRIGSFSIRYTEHTNRELFREAAAVLREIVG